MHGPAVLRIGERQDGVLVFASGIGVVSIIVIYFYAEGFSLFFSCLA